MEKEKVLAGFSSESQLKQKLINPVIVDEKPGVLVKPIVVDERPGMLFCPIVVDEKIRIPVSSIEPDEKPRVPFSPVECVDNPKSVEEMAMVEKRVVQDENAARAEELRIMKSRTNALLPLREDRKEEGFKLFETPKTLLYPCDDSGNADRFLDEIGDNVCFVRELGQFLVWNGRYWRADEGRAVKKMAEHAMIKYRDTALKFLEIIPEDMEKHARSSCNNARVNSLVDVLKHRLETSVTEFDKRLDLINVRNGVIDLRSGNLFPHNKELRMTAYIDVDYDMNVNFSNSSFARFLWSISCGDKEWCNYLQACMGYGLTGETKEQSLFLLYGKGSNGKTTLIEMIANTLGGYVKHLPIATLLGGVDKRSGSSPSPEIVHVKDARIVICSESNKNDAFDEGKIKALTGQSSISVRPLRKKNFELIPKFKIFIDTNHLPRFNSVEFSMKRRVKVIPFNATFKGEMVDKLLPEKLKAESEKKVILNWLVAGAMQFYINGLIQDESSMDATQEYFQECNGLGRFMQECVTTGGTSKCDATALYNTYVSFCGDNHLDVMTQTAFGKALTLNGFEKRRSSSGFYYVGVALNA